MYLLLPLESLTSLLKISDISKRNRWRSRPLRIRVLGSHTWNASCRISSPWDSMFSSNPEDIHCHQKPFNLPHVCLCVSVCVHSPSSMLKCMASFALLGTLSITSRPSLISPLPSSQHVRSSYKRKPNYHRLVTIKPFCKFQMNSRCFYLEEQLVLGYSLNRFDEVWRDGVGQAMPLLDFL